MTFCYSCGDPLMERDLMGPLDNFCKFCIDTNGNLSQREEVKRAVANWLASWQPRLDQETAMTRADCFLKAMPAWAETQPAES